MSVVLEITTCVPQLSAPEPAFWAIQAVPFHVSTCPVPGVVGLKLTPVPPVIPMVFPEMLKS